MERMRRLILTLLIGILLTGSGAFAAPPIRKDGGTAPTIALNFTVSLVPGKPTAGKPFMIRYRLTDPSGKPPTLDSTTPSPQSHLVVLSKDLTYFKHLHPGQMAPGEFEGALTLEHGGSYVAFITATPADDSPQVKRFAFEVAGPPAPKEESEPPAQANLDTVTSLDHDIYLSTLPEELHPGPAKLSFEITQGADLAKDLEPYLGMSGHLVVLSEDAEDYLDVRLLDPSEDIPLPKGMGKPLGNASGETHAPPVVTFLVDFPTDGLFRAWGEFQTPDGVIVAPFRVQVTPEI